MYTILQKAHSGWAYLALFLLVIAVILSVAGYLSKKSLLQEIEKSPCLL